MNTKQILINAMFNLMKQKSFDNITVQMILDESSVSRSTFYRYYRDKYDIMNDCYKHEVDKLTKNVADIGWEAVLSQILGFIKENQTFFKRAAEVDGINSFWNFLYNYSHAFHTNNASYIDEFMQIAITQTVAGEVEVVKRWLALGCQMEAEILSHYLVKLMPEGFIK